MVLVCPADHNLVLRAICVPARDEPHHTKYLLAVKPFLERQQMPWGRDCADHCLRLHIITAVVCQVMHRQVTCINLKSNIPIIKCTSAVFRR